jgi:hypothetical protein
LAGLQSRLAQVRELSVMRRVEAGAPIAGAQGGWPGGELQEVEPTQRVVTKRVRGKQKGTTSADDPYEVLGVNRGATARDIRAAYLRLVKEHHPDRHTRKPEPDGDFDAGEQLKAINEAYRKLKAVGTGRAWTRGRGVRFSIGALSSALPLLAVLGTYLGGWIGPRPRPDVAVAPGPQIQTTTSVQKDSAVGRQTAFADAKRLGSKTAWTKFIVDYPGGETEAYARQAVAAIERAEIAEARRREERQAWAVAEKGTKADLRQFMAKYADGEHAGKARAAFAAVVQTEQAAWTAAERAGTKEALQRFLDKHPDAADAPRASGALSAIAAAEAKARAELNSWTVAKTDGSKVALIRYLAEYPSGLHAAEARTRVAGLEAEERDEAAWRAALNANSKADFAGYVKAYPKGRRVTDAKVRISEIELAETLFAVKEAAKDGKEAVKEVRAEPVKSPLIGRPPPRAPNGPGGDEMPFVGVDGRIRR